ncbi:MAG: ankyrin repeat domain-containing protein [Planctomycetaceae bacterium]
MNKTLNGELLEAVRHGDEAKVRALVRQGADPFSNDGVPFIVSLKYPSIFSLFVSLRERFGDGDIPRAGQVFFDDDTWRFALPILIPKLVHPNVTDNIGVSLLYEAIRERMNEAVELLTNRGAALTECEKLHIAIYHGESDRVCKLLASGVDPNYVYDEKTPLYLAVLRDNCSSWKALLGHGADTERESPWFYSGLAEDRIDNRDSKGDVPLWLAAGKGMMNAVEDLLEAGANPLHRNYWNHTPFIEAVLSGQSEAAKRLYRLTPDCGSPNWKMLFGCLVGDVQVVRESIAEGADTRFKGTPISSKYGPLGYSVRSKNIELVTFLCQECALRIRDVAIANDLVETLPPEIRRPYRAIIRPLDEKLAPGWPEQD